MPFSIRDRMPRWKFGAARAMRKNPTPAEAELWRSLRCRRLAGWKFKRQSCILGYVVDFYCPKLRLVVEVDGDYHRSPERVAWDRRRDAAMRRHGLRVVRVTNHEVFTRMACMRIVCAVDEYNP